MRTHTVTKQEFIGMKSFTVLCSSSGNSDGISKRMLLETEIRSDGTLSYQYKVTKSHKSNQINSYIGKNFDFAIESYNSIN
jgi:hypothetical protein